MLLFDPASILTYAEEQEHSALVDSWIGLDIANTEQAIIQRSGLDHAQEDHRGESPRQYWIGLPPQTLQTPYTELQRILSLLAPEPGDSVVDLGAGYGRMAFVMAAHFPDVRFIGYEAVIERVREGQRCLKLHGLDPQTLKEQDLSQESFSPLPAKFYFLYDFGSREAIEKTLRDLRKIAASSPKGITVVGRGRASRDAIERKHPWLSQVVPAQHFSRFSIYRTQPISNS